MGWTRRLRPTTCAASSATRWNTARRRSWRSTAWPTTRGTRRPTIRSTTGSGGSRNWFPPRRARRTAPLPSIRATRRRATAATSVVETETFRIADYTPGRPRPCEEFERVVAAPGVLESAANREPLAEPRPWLAEFRQAGRTGAPDARSHRMLRDGDDAVFWSGYVRNRMSAADRSAYEAHKSGTMKPSPSTSRRWDDMAAGFTRLTGRRVCFGPRHRVLPTRHDAEPPDARPRPLTFYTSGRAQRPATGSASIWEPCARFPLR